MHPRARPSRPATGRSPALGRRRHTRSRYPSCHRQKKKRKTAKSTTQVAPDRSDRARNQSRNGKPGSADPPTSPGPRPPALSLAPSSRHAGARHSTFSGAGPSQPPTPPPVGARSRESNKNVKPNKNQRPGQRLEPSRGHEHPECEHRDGDVRRAAGRPSRYIPLSPRLGLVASRSGESLAAALGEQSNLGEGGRGHGVWPPRRPRAARVESRSIFCFLPRSRSQLEAPAAPSRASARARRPGRGCSFKGQPASRPGQARKFTTRAFRHFPRKIIWTVWRAASGVRGQVGGAGMRAGRRSGASRTARTPRHRCSAQLPQVSSGKHRCCLLMMSHPFWNPEALQVAESGAPLARVAVPR